MAVEKWSEKVTVARLADDPQLTDELQALEQSIGHAPVDIVLDFESVNYINSSNLARLLKLRKMLVSHECKLVFCNVRTEVWGAFMITGLDKLFLVSDNVATALATLQIAR